MKLLLAALLYLASQLGWTVPTQNFKRPRAPACAHVAHNSMLHRGVDVLRCLRSGSADCYAHLVALRCHGNASDRPARCAR